nr:hypothetical protein [Tanacetum cinerariifolium]
MVESSKKTKLKKFDFVTESGEHVPLTKEHVSTQNKIEEEAKAEAARHEGEKRKEKLINLLGLKVVNTYYNDKLQANKRLKSSVQYKDHLTSTVLNEPVLGLDHHAKTFSSLLPAEIDKRNMNPLKQMRVIEQLRQWNKLKHVVSLLEGLQSGEIFLYVKRNKEISLRNVTSKVELLNAQDTNPTLRKKPHVDQDPPNNCEGDKRSKRMKDARESTSKSSNKDKAPMDYVQDDILDDMRKDFFKVEICNRSTHKVYSDKRIITVVSVDVKKKWGYDFLMSIKVKRTNNKEYEFSYANLSRVNLNDIEDMYLLKVQGKLHHLKLEFKIDFINALLLYTRRVVIKNMIEDTQLGVESYQRTLNLTKPKFHFSRIDHKIPYKKTRTEKGVVYPNKYDVKSLMHCDEVHKFYDDTILKVKDRLLKMLKENRLGRGNVKLKGRE